jgi:hypothetical protein
MARRSFVATLVFAQFRALQSPADPAEISEQEISGEHMRHVVALVLLAAVIGAPLAGAAQVSRAAAERAQMIGGTVVRSNQTTITGLALTPTGQTLSNMMVQARNLLNGRISGSAPVAATGRFSIGGLEPASYVVEVVDATGQVVGTSSFISAAAGSTVSVTITATSGTLSAVGAVTGLAARLTTAAESVKYAAAAAGVAGMVAPVDVRTTSPSR